MREFAQGLSKLQQRYSQQWMIEKLQQLAARLGRSPTQADATADPDIPSHTTYVKRFGRRQKGSAAQ